MCISYRRDSSWWVNRAHDIGIPFMHRASNMPTAKEREREDGDVAELELHACMDVMCAAFTINIGSSDEGESNGTATFKRATSTDK